MKTVTAEIYNEYTPAPMRGFSLTCTSKQREEIAKYQQGGISFAKKGRDQWLVTFRYHPRDGDALSLNSTASTICEIAGYAKPVGVNDKYWKRVIRFFNTGF